MSALLQTLTIVLPPLYLLGALLAGFTFGRPPAPRMRFVRRTVTVLLLLAHASWFYVYSERVQGFPIDDLASSLSAIALSTFVLQCVLARWFGHGGSGTIVLALLFCLQIVSACLTDLRALPRAGTIEIDGIAHVLTSVIALAALVLSGLHGLLYLVLFRQMRERHFGALFAGLPDLDVLARLTRGAALAGFIGLTIGLNVGIMMAHRDHQAGFAYRESEVALSILLWLHFGGIAFSGFMRGFNARRASIAATVGLVLILLSLALVLIPGTTFHSRL